MVDFYLIEAPMEIDSLQSDWEHTEGTSKKMPPKSLVSLLKFIESGINSQNKKRNKY